METISSDHNELDDSGISDQMKQISKMLSEIRNGAKLLAYESKKVISAEEKKRKSQSSWAKSSSAKIKYNLNRDASSYNQELYKGSSEKVDRGADLTKYTPPAFSFGQRSAWKEENIYNDIPAPGNYSTDKLDKLSSHKRASTVILASTSRRTIFDEEISKVPIVANLHRSARINNKVEKVDLIDKSDQRTSMDVTIPEDLSSYGTTEKEKNVDNPPEEGRTLETEAVVDHEREKIDEYIYLEVDAPPPKSYSFGKAKRLLNNSPNSSEILKFKKRSNQTDEDWLLFETDVPTNAHSFGKEKRFLTPTKHLEPPLSYERASKSPNRANRKGIDLLSYRTKTTNISINPDRPKSSGIGGYHSESELPPPGPGSYRFNDKVQSHISNSYSGSLYKNKGLTIVASNPKAMELLQRRNYAKRLSSGERGPGSYLVENSESYFHSIHGGSTVYRADHKDITPQLARKRYWEQKEFDMRQTNDDMKLVDDAVLRPHTASVRYIPDYSSLGPSTSDEKKLKHHFDCVSRKSMETMDRMYDVNHSVTERRAPSGVYMQSEIDARQSTQRMIHSKQAVLHTILNRRDRERSKEKYYGPQLPIRWVPDKPSMAWDKRQHDHTLNFSNNRSDEISPFRPKRRRSRSAPPLKMRDDSGEADNDSPTKDVLRFLSQRAAAQYEENDPIVGMDPVDEQETKLTEAFLQSSYSGSLMKKPPVVSMTKPSLDSRHQDGIALSINEQQMEDDKRRDYLGPQLQPDWLEHSESRHQRHRYNAMKMDRTKGREKVQIISKGIKLVTSFSEPSVAEDIKNARPDIGAYDHDALFRIGAPQNSKSVLKFSDMVSRDDAVGPHGEKPMALQMKLDIGLSEDLYFRDELDIDYGEAKDAASRHHEKNRLVKLYHKERYPQEVDAVEGEGDDHLGGSWFKGMDHELQNKNPTVNFSKMSGRNWHEIDTLHDILSNDELLQQHGKEGDVLEVEVTDWHPHKSSAPTYQMQDTEKYPRFGKEKASEVPSSDQPRPASPNYKLVRPRTDYIGVDMVKMQGRNDNGDHDREVVHEEMMGQIDKDEAMRIGAEYAANIINGVDYTSKLKKPSKTRVNISKQSGREDNPIGPEVDNLVENDGGKLFYKNISKEKAKEKFGSQVKNQNLLDFDHHIGRSVDEEGLIADDEMFPMKDELILNPNRHTIDSHAMQGVHWSKNNQPRGDPHGHNVELDQDIDGYVPRDKILDLGDVDGGPFKKGGMGIGKDKSGKGVPSISMQRGRVTKTDEDLLLEQDIPTLADKEGQNLVLQEKWKENKPTNRLKFGKTSDTNEFDRVAERNFYGETLEKLDLQPKEEKFGSGVASGNVMMKQIGRLIPYEDEINRKLNYETDEEVMVEDVGRARDQVNQKKGSGRNSKARSMKDSLERQVSANGLSDNVLQEMKRNENCELILDDKNIASAKLGGKATSKVVSMSSQVPRSKSTKEEKAEQDIRDEVGKVQDTWTSDPSKTKGNQIESNTSSATFRSNVPRSNTLLKKSDNQAMDDIDNEFIRDGLSNLDLNTRNPLKQERTVPQNVTATQPNTNRGLAKKLAGVGSTALMNQVPKVLSNSELAATREISKENALNGFDGGPARDERGNLVTTSDKLNAPKSALKYKTTSFSTNTKAGSEDEKETKTFATTRVRFLYPPIATDESPSPPRLSVPAISAPAPKNKSDSFALNSNKKESSVQSKSVSGNSTSSTRVIKTLATSKKNVKSNKPGFK